MTQNHNAILVTGASGFLGAQVLRDLQAQNKSRKILTASRSGRQLTAGSVIQPIQHLCINVEDEIVLPMGIHTIIHIAGEKRDEAKMEAVNHHGTRRLIEAALKSGVQRLVYVSSVGVYGANTHAGLVTETFPHTPQNVYETSKDSGEHCVRTLCSRYGMEYIVVQPSNVIGFVSGSAYPLLGLMRTLQLGRFTWFGNTNPWVNYVAMESVAAAILVASEKADSGETFIINTPAKLSDVVNWISDELKITPPQRRLPLWIGQAAGEMGSILEKFTGRAMPFSREKLRELTNTTQYDGSSLTRTTGFNYPLSAEQLIRGLVNTYRREGKL